MSFNTAVSGLHAAHKRMEVAGNNIANVHTSGFKSSRAEFSAVYSSSMLGGSRTASGDGVQVANVSQNFAPGGVITSEGRALDMRIQGNGFFVMSDAGSISYGRSGAFIKDAQNFVVDSHGSRLQGYGVTDAGEVISGVRTDLKIDAADMSPKATGKMEQTLNLNAASPSLGAIPRFDPGDPTTYTRVTGRLIQDAGVPPQDHELKQYFVKTEDDNWTSYILVDGVNPLDPTSTAPLEIGLQVSAAGRLSVTGSTAAVKMISDTELSLQKWRPAINVNGSWTASPAPAPGPISLPLLDGGLPVLDPADSLMPRPVPTFNPADITTYTKASTYGVFDSLGMRHEMTQYFVKDGSNSWKMHTLIDGRNPQDPTSTAPSTASMLFDSGGSLQSLIGSQWLTAANNTLTLEGWVPAKPLDGNKPGGRWGANGAVGNADGIVMDFNKISQHNAATGSINPVIDGHAAGQATQLTIDKSGMLMIGFSNGLHRNVGQVMLASFANNQGLQPVSDTRWVETLASGVANYDSPGVGTLGSVIGHSLEGSNVTLTNELVELIQAQTAYQANSKTLSTEAELMQTLIRAT
ncbi:flagellar hook-basal body complex protein [Pseudomonas sp. CFBP 13711]|uniref:flagellar hook protein FlgE n=1 Tax=unclassified Pseudomonas TaxID=196821 RepID=UPI001782F9C6|nr:MULTISPECIES: flagellar hook protein FlgE [unclassified Pseudomonas]MBD8707155.1 flagellar hook-basal body complex protein [Pseudomonas sp. CFBP 13711]MBD8712691.1 flagellar hook-basal body complex protein [Pseudomonas sp. CFBP 13715]